jgi:hypothetical protein
MTNRSAAASRPAGQLRRVVCLAGAADAHRAALGIKRRPTEDERFRRTMARATEACETRSFEDAWAEGSRLTPGQAKLEPLDLAATLAALAPALDNGPFTKVAPARTSATRWGALTQRQRA